MGGLSALINATTGPPSQGHFEIKQVNESASGICEHLIAFMSFTSLLKNKNAIPRFTV